MEFEELTIKEKVEATLKNFKYRDKLAAKGKKDADQHKFSNQCKIKKRQIG
ncbi:hypothetical protein [Clostridium estertheticum]|uniref:hypothetical protein n=1 Tax=Clostridium estertheticum TaxID=238834 RepID=UPI001C6E5960|nr:hypothetical protein [Clostridium estertheticum]MBW9154256.1 hypothetical protein [Clostridium estertheticum]WLC86684.1 hypothetical protein KTC97_21925 [Clostridium estertheticum]